MNISSENGDLVISCTDAAIGSSARALLFCTLPVLAWAQMNSPFPRDPTRIVFELIASSEEYLPRGRSQENCSMLIGLSSLELSAKVNPDNVTPTTRFPASEKATIGSECSEQAVFGEMNPGVKISQLPSSYPTTSPISGWNTAAVAARDSVAGSRLGTNESVLPS